MKARVDRNLQLFEEGRLEYRKGDDLFRLMISDGKLNAKPEITERITLKEFFDRCRRYWPWQTRFLGGKRRDVYYGSTTLSLKYRRCQLGHTYHREQKQIKTVMPIGI